MGALGQSPLLTPFPSGLAVSCQAGAQATQGVYLALIVVDHSLVVLHRCLQLLDLQMSLVEFVLHRGEASLKKQPERRFKIRASLPFVYL